MPLGERMRETGFLRRDGRRVVLELDGGGRWRLDLPSGAEPLLGRRVWVDATRADYDLLDVDRIGREGEAPIPSRGRLLLLTEGALIALALILSALSIR